MVKVTLKSLGIKATTIRKHGVLVNVWQYKGRFWTSKQRAIDQATKRARK